MSAELEEKLREEMFADQLARLRQAESALTSAMERLTFYVVGLELAFVGYVLLHISEVKTYGIGIPVVGSVTAALIAAFAGLVWKYASNVSLSMALRKHEDKYGRFLSAAFGGVTSETPAEPVVPPGRERRNQILQSANYAVYVTLSIAWYVLTAALAVGFLVKALFLPAGDGA